MTKKDYLCQMCASYVTHHGGRPNNSTIADWSYAYDSFIEPLCEDDPIPVTKIEPKIYITIEKDSDDGNY